MVHQQHEVFAEWLADAGSPQLGQLLKMLTERVNRILIAMAAEHITVVIIQVLMTSALIVAAISLSQPQGEGSHCIHHSPTPRAL
jgi:hypothetical protein